jgi:hypothetical protein
LRSILRRDNFARSRRNIRYFAQAESAEKISAASIRHQRQFKVVPLSTILLMVFIYLTQEIDLVV